MMENPRFCIILLVRAFKLLLILALAWVCAGCTVAQLAAGDKGTDITKIQPGRTRTEAEAVIKDPIREWKSSSGVTYRTYQYDSGRPPGVADAVAFGLMDVVSLGLFEAFEALANATGDSRSISKYMEDQHTKTRLVVSYDDQDIILGIFGEFDELPPDGRSSSRQWNR
jgi:hypothetical protein